MRLYTKMLLIALKRERNHGVMVFTSMYNLLILQFPSLTYQFYHIYTLQECMLPMMVAHVRLTDKQREDPFWNIFGRYLSPDEFTGKILDSLEDVNLIPKTIFLMSDSPTVSEIDTWT